MEEEKKHSHTIHHILAYSYFTFFVALIVGLFFDILYPIRIWSTPPIALGVFLMFTATLLIVWAQMTSKKTKGSRMNLVEVTHHHFKKGPYRFMRSPTHVGLTLCLFGYALIDNSLMLVTSTFIFAVIVRFIFVFIEEKMLAEKYGNAYHEYKKSVKL